MFKYRPFRDVFVMMGLFFRERLKTKSLNFNDLERIKPFYFNVLEKQTFFNETLSNALQRIVKINETLFNAFYFKRNGFKIRRNYFQRFLNKKET